jgi:alanine racemase
MDFDNNYVIIELDAIVHNIEAVRKKAGTAVMAVVKADAYGHCVQRVARVYDEAGATWFAVSNLEEALQLRQMGLRQRILILSYTPPEAVKTLAAEAITTAVVSREHAEALDARAAAEGVSHLKRKGNGLILPLQEWHAMIRDQD